MSIESEKNIEKGAPIPVVITAYKDRSFEFVTNMRANPTVKNSSGGSYEVYGRIAGGSSYINGDNNEAAAVHPDHDTFPGRSFTLTGVWNWHSTYNDTIAVRFNSVVFEAEI